MNALAEDLDHVLKHTDGLWEELRGQRIFLTGGTGFFGCWLLESLLWANDKLRLRASVVVLTRNPAAFMLKAPHLAFHPAVKLHEGDIRTFDFPKGAFSHVIHAAQDYRFSLEQFNTTIEGTRRTLEFAVQAGAVRYLFTSSGAVYGTQPPSLARVTETYCGAPNTTSMCSAYAEAKRASEWLCFAYHERYGLITTISRGFAFIGPYLNNPVTAVSNFFMDALRGGPIRINADGSPFRSYLYGADLAVWLWIILLRGKPCYPYNVGSDVDLTISELARLVASAFNPKVEIFTALQPQPGKLAERYVPSISRAREELGLEPWVGLSDSIRRTAAWFNRSKSRNKTK